MSTPDASIGVDDHVGRDDGDARRPGRSSVGRGRRRPGHAARGSGGRRGAGGRRGNSRAGLRRRPVRPAGPRRRPDGGHAGPGQSGDPHPRGADRRGDRSGGGRICRRGRTGAPAGRHRDRCLDPGRGRRPSGPAYEHRDRDGRTVRRGGGHLSTAGAQRSRCPGAWALGARHRSPALRLGGGELAAAVAGGAAADPLLRQGGGRVAGHRADSGELGPDPGHLVRGTARRVAGRARLVLRPRRHLAVASAARTSSAADRL